MVYRIEITHTGPDNPAAMGIYEVADLDAATMQLHQVLSSAISNPSVTDALVMIIDPHGAVLRYEFWERKAL